MLAAAIIRTTSDLIWAVDADGFGLLAFNKGMADYFLEHDGRRLERGARPEDLFPPGEPSERWRALYQRALHEGAFRADRVALHWDRIFQLELWPIRRGGTITAVAVFGRDVTEWTRLEWALKQSESRLQSLLELAPVPLAIAARHSDTLQMNRACRALFRVPLDAAPSKRSFGECFTPECREQVIEYATRRRAGLPAPDEYDAVGLRTDGTTFPVHVSATVIELPDGLAGLAALTDLTARNEAETALREREAFFRAVLQRSPDIAAVVGRDGRLTFLSSSVQMVLGWTEEEMPGFETLIDLVHEEDRDRVGAMMAAIVSRPEGLERIVCRMRHKDGWYREVAVTGRNLLGDPSVQGVVLNARDLAEFRRVEQQLRDAQRLESVGRLAAGVAHDFNNVLTVILSSAESLRRQLEQGLPVSREDVDQVNSAAERARDFTCQLLALARRQVIATEPLDLNRVVESARKMLARLVGEDVDLVLDLEPGLWAVRLDPAQVDQILLNLVANARDALPRGGRVEIATRNVELGDSTPAWPGAKPGQYVALRVSDNGVGMTDRVRSRLFDPFFTTKELGRGTGLGLASVHGIVSQNGGHVRVESAPGSGSRFELLFARTMEEVATPPPVNADVVTGGSETILLVEDDVGVRRQALRTLAAAGYQVHVAADGLEALEILATVQPPPDLLLTDVVMPRLDGPGLAGIARERWPGVRIVFISGYADDRLTTTGVLRPRIDLLRKPFTGTVLLQKLRSVLDRPT